VRSASASLARRSPRSRCRRSRTCRSWTCRARHEVAACDIDPKYLRKILLRTYETAPADFESLLSIEGVGAKTLRALALTSELIYGTRCEPERSGALFVRARRQGRNAVSRSTGRRTTRRSK
jgi:hypothetical protein